MAVRESPDELTLRAGKVATLKVYVNVDHIETARWGLLWLITIGMLSVRRCKRYRRRRKGRNVFLYREMSMAVGVKKPQEAQKAHVLWKMKAAKEAGEEYFNSTREEGIKERNETRLARWEEHLEDPIVALDKALQRVEDQY